MLAGVVFGGLGFEVGFYHVWFVLGVLWFVGFRVKAFGLIDVDGFRV